MTDEGGWSGLLPAHFGVVFSWCDVFVVLVKPEPSLPSDDGDRGRMLRELLPSDLESIEPACWKGCSEPPRRWPVEASVVVAVAVAVLELTGAMAHQSRSSGCREERGAGTGAGGADRWVCWRCRSPKWEEEPATLSVDRKAPRGLKLGLGSLRRTAAGLLRLPGGECRHLSHFQASGGRPRRVLLRCFPLLGCDG